MQNFQPKRPFSFRSRPKNHEGKSRSSVKGICAIVTKHALKKIAKAEVNLNRSNRLQMFFELVFLKISQV